MGRGIARGRLSLAISWYAGDKKTIEVLPEHQKLLLLENGIIFAKKE